jgi:hypothetical protein
MTFSGNESNYYIKINCTDNYDEYTVCDLNGNTHTYLDSDTQKNVLLMAQDACETAFVKHELYVREYYFCNILMYKSYENMTIICVPCNAPDVHNLIL